MSLLGGCFLWVVCGQSLETMAAAIPPGGPCVIGWVNTPSGGRGREVWELFPRLLPEVI